MSVLIVCARAPSGCLLEDGRGVGKFLDVPGDPGAGGLDLPVLGVGGCSSSPWPKGMGADSRFTSVPLSANLSIGMSAMIKAQSLNLLVGFE